MKSISVLHVWTNWHGMKKIQDKLRMTHWNLSVFESVGKMSSHHFIDLSDVMRRLVKEELLWFDGTPLVPERIVYTLNYDLSPNEAVLYRKVTNYVLEEFNRADQLNSERKQRLALH